MATVKKIKKAQGGDTLPDYRNMSKVRKTTTAKDSADYKSGFQKVMSGKAENFPNRAEKYGQGEAALRKSTPKKSGKLKNLNIFSDGGSTKKAKNGMLKRADGSYSKRGLWDNIRAAKGSGKKPTAAMLKQEKKIKAKTKK